MGLAMVHGFVTQSGGEISIRSVLGEGTTVELCFPVTAERTDQKSGIDNPANLLGDEKILLVEDDDDVRSALRQRLSTSGFRVTEASDGTSALKLVSKPTEFDLVVTDLTMPGPVQGMDLVRRIREALGEIPIVILTGYGTDALDELADTSRCILLSKPVSGPALISRIRQLLDA